MRNGVRYIRCVLFFSLAAVVVFPHAARAETGSVPVREDIRTDLRTLNVCREGLARTLAFAESRPDLFNPGREKRKGLPSRREKVETWGAWSAVLDYTSALDAVMARHGNFMGYVSGERKRTSFSLLYAAFLAEYRYALEFIALSEKNPALDTILDEPVPEFGLAGGSYSRFKFRFLNVMRATEFAAFMVVDKGLPGRNAGGLRPFMQQDAAVIQSMGRGKGPVLTFANGISIVGKLGFAAWFPVQKGVSEFMGDVKVRHVGKSFISAKQVRALRPRLQPGDILLERREWYLSNMGLPGFWTHVALYVGTAAERRNFFNDAEVSEWVRGRGESSGDFEALLGKRYTAAYGISGRTGEGGHLPRVIEAISEGVSFTTLEHTAAADSLAVLRPRLSRREKAEALLRAFHYSGRPYDFNFDFRTDSALVCSELVYKVYEPSPGMRGLRFPLANVMGKTVSLPNDMARQFSEQYRKAEQQTDLIVFLDGDEKTESARDADLAEFGRSWERPKWHILTRKSPEKKDAVRTAARQEPTP